MSKYTTEVRWIVETKAKEALGNSYSASNINTNILAVIDDIFDTETQESLAPLEATLRPRVFKLILRHYYTREICAETVGLWKLWINSRLQEVLPYFGRLYDIQAKLFLTDPLKDVDYTKTHDGSESEDGTHSRESSENSEGGETSRENITDTKTTVGDNWEKYSDTPQGSLNNVDEMAYLTNATKTDTSLTETDTKSDNITKTNTNERTGEESGSTHREGENEFTERVQGKWGAKTYAAMLSEYEQAVKNIDRMVIDSVSDMFFRLW